MKFPKLRIMAASIIILLGSQSGNALAENIPAGQQMNEGVSKGPDRAPGAAQAPAARPTPPSGYRGYPPPRYERRYYRDRMKPFGSSGPSFSGPWDRGSGPSFSGPWDRGRGSSFGGPWDRGSGPGFSTGGPSFGSGGPSFGSSRGPRYGSRDDWGPEPFYDDPYFDRGSGFYDRGPGDWDRGGSGMGFDW